MIELQGQGVSKGIAEGILYVLPERKQELNLSGQVDVRAERDRFRAAQEKTLVQLGDMEQECGKDAIDVLRAHAVMVADVIFTEAVEKSLREHHCNAEFAVYEAGEQLAAVFEAMEDPYVKARALDVRDVSWRIRQNLKDAGEKIVLPETPVILGAGDLAPSEFMRLDKSRLLGVVLKEGSFYSHTAILARTMEIPVICGLGRALKPEYHGRTVYMDGNTGCLYLNPDESLLAERKKAIREQQNSQDLWETVKGMEDVAADGTALQILCNINLPEDVEAVVAHDGRGIGLFRTEFLWLREQKCPEEETQFVAYKRVAEAMEGKRVVIRTMDLGADKLPENAGKENELRGIRYSLEHPKIFKEQLRALYRASVYGEMAVLFPMISSVREVRQCKQLCQQVMEELDEYGIPYRKDMELGIMIETQEAVWAAEELAKEVDFFSVGTNDLIRSVKDKSCGKENESEVLHYVEQTAKAARRAGIPVGICGELGADKSLLPVFLDLGIRILSVTPSEVMPLRAELLRLRGKLF